MEIKKIELSDKEAVRALSALASRIVKEYYDPLLGAAQNDYMIEKFQSVPAIEHQLEAGYNYYEVFAGGKPAGFMGFYPRGNELYLSKLYLDKAYRGQGLGKKMLDFIVSFAKENSLCAVELNVNKYNPTVQIYEKMGFVRARSEKNDIGCGYYMDDYVYRLELG